MSKEHQFGDYTMNEGSQDHPQSIVDILTKTGNLRPGSRPAYVSDAPIEEEESILSSLDPLIGSVMLERPRERVVDCLRAIVRDAFARHSLPMDSGLDIGSGASGYMVAKLFPFDAQGKWLQMELNPQAVEINKKKNPSLPVMQGSYHRLQKQGVRSMFPVITGLSSLDATQHLAHAVKQIRDGLRDGGSLFHVQDVRPGLDVVHRQLKELAAPEPYATQELQGPTAGLNTVLTYKGQSERINVVELFRQRLGAVIQNTPGLELLENQWVTAGGKNKESKNDRQYSMGIYLELPADRSPIQQASAVVTVARKV